MLKSTDYYSCVTLEDFNKYLSSKTGYINTGTPAINEWTFDTNLNAARINVDSTKAGFLRFPGFYLDVGDVIEVQVDFLNLSGAKGIIAIDHSVNENFSGFTSAEQLRTVSGDNFEISTLRFVARKDGYHRCAAGLLTTDVGEIYIRDYLIRIYKKQKIESNIRKSVFRKDPTLGFVQRTDFANDPCTLTVEPDGKTVTVTFRSSLGSLKALGFVNHEYVTTSNAYIARCSYVTGSSAKIQFFPLAPTPSNTPVDISALPAETHFNLLLIV